VKNFELFNKVTKHNDTLRLYIKFRDNFTIYAIILTITPKKHIFSDNSQTYGAYYGYHGGAVNDGGFFRLSNNRRKQEIFDYAGLETIKEMEANILENLMQKIWEIVDDQNGEGDLILTEAGNNLIKRNGGVYDGVFTLNDFDGSLLAGIQWGLMLQFDY